MAYQILCIQIDGMAKEVRAIKERGEEPDPKGLQFISAMREGAKLLNWERNCNWSVEEAVKNMAQKNYKLIDRSVAIDALSKIDPKDFNFNTVCNILRKCPKFDFKTSLDLSDFITAAKTMINEEEFQNAKKELEKKRKAAEAENSTGEEAAGADNEDSESKS